MLARPGPHWVKLRLVLDPGHVAKGSAKQCVLHQLTPSNVTYATSLQALPGLLVIDQVGLVEPDDRFGQRVVVVVPAPEGGL
jgi:hypothetical protein